MESTEAERGAQGMILRRIAKNVDGLDLDRPRRIVIVSFSRM